MISFQSIAKEYHANDFQVNHQLDLFACKNHRMAMTLRARIKTTRKLLGLTQAQLAKNAGLKNQSIVGMLESGDHMASVHLPALAKALGVNVIWLQTGEGQKDASCLEGSGLNSEELNAIKNLRALPLEAARDFYVQISRMAGFYKATDLSNKIKQTQQQAG